MAEGDFDIGADLGDFGGFDQGQLLQLLGMLEGGNFGFDPDLQLGDDGSFLTGIDPGAQERAFQESIQGDAQIIKAAPPEKQGSLITEVLKNNIGPIGALGLGSVLAILGFMDKGGGKLQAPDGRTVQLSPQEQSLLDVINQQAQQTGDISRKLRGIENQSIDRNIGSLRGMYDSSFRTADAQTRGQEQYTNTVNDLLFGKGLSSAAPTHQMQTKNGLPVQPGTPGEFTTQGGVSYGDDMRMPPGFDTTGLVDRYTADGTGWYDSNGQLHTSEVMQSGGFQGQYLGPLPALSQLSSETIGSGNKSTPEFERWLRENLGPNIDPLNKEARELYTRTTGISADGTERTLGPTRYDPGSNEQAWSSDRLLQQPNQNTLLRDMLSGDIRNAQQSQGNLSQLLQEDATPYQFQMPGMYSGEEDIRNAANKNLLSLIKGGDEADPYLERQIQELEIKFLE